MSEMAKLKYPPCNVNPLTEKPYTRHKWGIAPRQPKMKRGIAFYPVSCVRCGVNDPQPPSY